jgi:FixJ family two-component response regulator
LNPSLTTPAPEATVLVVDDDTAIRRGLSRLVRAAGFSVKTFASPAEFLRHEFPAGPACVVLDVCMQELTGLDVQNALRSNGRNLPIIFLSGQGTIPVVTATIKLGAEDFLEKPVRRKVLLEAIHRAVERDRAGMQGRASHKLDHALYDTLTPREKQVMALVVTGLLNKQVAAELGISEKTIKVHRARVMEKMKVESLAALVRLAERVVLHAAPGQQ